MVQWLNDETERNITRFTCTNWTQLLPLGGPLGGSPREALKTNLQPLSSDDGDGDSLPSHIQVLATIINVSLFFIISTEASTKDRFTNSFSLTNINLQ